MQGKELEKLREENLQLKILLKKNSIQYKFWINWLNRLNNINRDLFTIDSKEHENFKIESLEPIDKQLYEEEINQVAIPVLINEQENLQVESERLIRENCAMRVESKNVENIEQLINERYLLDLESFLNQAVLLENKQMELKINCNCQMN